jgi:hypothetical protein
MNGAIQSLDFISEVSSIHIGSEDNLSTVSFIVLDADKSPALINENAVDLSRNKVWQVLFESTYRKSQPTDEVFDTTTWVSTYDHAVMPAAEISIWQQETVKRIVELDPKSIWEIGCGSGLLMWPLLDRVDYFYGTDLSKDIINRVSKSLADKNISKVKLEYRAPEDIPSFDAPTFDLAVINSVAQYFSGVNYFIQVIQSALNASKKGLFIGDVRSLAHHEVFLTSVELFQAQDSQLPNDIYIKAQAKLKSERELLIHDAYFLKLAANPHLPLAVDAKIKRGTFSNEMSRWRYDVSLTKVDFFNLAEPSISCAWSGIDELRKLLFNSQGQAVEILGIPNIRVAADVWATQNLRDFSGDVGELKSQAKIETADAVDPDLLFNLADELNLRVRVIWSQQNLANVHALFEPKGESIQSWTPDKKRVPYQLTSDPAGKSLEKKVLELVIAQLKTVLAEDSLPNKVIKLDCMPLTENGELDLVTLEKMGLNS